MCEEEKRVSSLHRSSSYAAVCTALFRQTCPSICGGVIVLLFLCRCLCWEVDGKQWDISVPSFLARVSVSHIHRRFSSPKTRCALFPVVLGPLETTSYVFSSLGKMLLFSFNAALLHCAVSHEPAGWRTGDRTHVHVGPQCWVWCCLMCWAQFPHQLLSEPDVQGWIKVYKRPSMLMFYTMMTVWQLLLPFWNDFFQEDIVFCTANSKIEFLKDSRCCHGLVKVQTLQLERQAVPGSF